MKERFGPDADPALHESGYLILAPGGERGDPRGEPSHAGREGAPVALLDPAALGAALRPGSRPRGSAAGSLGLSGEGWFDSHTLLQDAPRRRARCRRDARHRRGDRDRVEAGRVVAVRLADGGRIGCGTLVNAAGPSAGRVAAWPAGRCRSSRASAASSSSTAPDAPRDMPLVADPSGIWVRPEGAASSPAIRRRRPMTARRPGRLSADHALFEEHLWPALARSRPGLRAAEGDGRLGRALRLQHARPERRHRPRPRAAEFPLRQRLFRARPAAGAGRRPSGRRADRPRRFSLARPLASSATSASPPGARSSSGT